MSESLVSVLRESERMARLDGLSQMIVQVRDGQHVITDAEAEALYDARVAETKHDPFDGAVYDRLWCLLEYCPPYEKLHHLAHFMVDRPEMSYRGHAVRYLLRAYPSEARDLVAKLDGDEDPEVQDAIAGWERTRDPERAVKRWESILGSGELSHELAEMVPIKLAYGYDEDALGDALDRYERMDQDCGGGSVWGGTAGAIAARLESIRKRKA